MTSHRKGQYEYNWTNPSVLSFAGAADPIQAIEEEARKVTLRAIDTGWHGPPYDPIILAEMLDIAVSGNANINDARTVSLSKERFKIEFNPNRPRGRVRFSIAHEIAHTFFPDCAERTRYRDKERHSRKDDWQLELLCNIAAAELVMPVASLKEHIDSELSLGLLLDLRKRYDVSLEAILIRAVKLSQMPCNIFCASMDEEGRNKGRYKIDYLIPSMAVDEVVPIGTYLPVKSLVTKCTAIGFTASGSEKWRGASKSVRIECVGLPPYPGKLYPRVAGIVFTEQKTQIPSPSIKYVTNDALDQQEDDNKIIAHVVNDKTPNWGGRGFARAVRERYPEVQRSFKSWWASAGDHFSLGNVHSCSVDNITFVQMIAQRGYGGRSAEPRIRYYALEKCLKEVAKIAVDVNASVHMPRIGCGYGGGNWEIIEELLIENIVKKGINVTVYSLPAKEVRDVSDTFLEEYA